MEVFLTNVPWDLTDRSLTVALTPMIDAIDLGRAWRCQKTRKRSLATLTFLHEDEGAKFLSEYGAVDVPGTTRPDGWPRQTSRLHLEGRHVFCRRSRNKLNDFLLRSLAKSSKESENKAAKSIKDNGQGDGFCVDFYTESFSWGYYSYDEQDELNFIKEEEWRHPLSRARFTKYQLTLALPIAGRLVKVEIPYSIIESIVVSTHNLTLTMTLWEVPRFYGPSQDPSSRHRAPLERLTKLGDEKSLAFLHHKDMTNPCLVYSFSADTREFYKKTEALMKSELLPISYHKISERLASIECSVSRGMERFRRLIRESAQVLPFDLCFQFQALVQNSIILPWQAESVVKRLVKCLVDQSTADGELQKVDAYLVSTTFVRWHADSSKFPPFSARAVGRLQVQLPFAGLDVEASVFQPENIWNAIMDNERAVQEEAARIQVSERAQKNLTPVYKVQVTPTGFTLHGPSHEATNRVLRRYPEHTEYFVRVQFTEEDGSDLRFNPRVSLRNVYDHFRSTSKKGIEIGGRVYTFLGFSHSSLRSHSAWFIAPFLYRGVWHDYFQVISYLGDFGSIRSPARCAARIGQAFSETPYAIEYSTNGIIGTLVKDIEHHGRVFTDGVGMISQEVNDLIRGALPQQMSDSTCYQVRLGGAKGMLALHPLLQGRQVCLRPSMVKFSTEAFENLEICEVSKAIPFVLNRQLVKIMEDMRVPDAFFFKHQNRELRRLRLITAHTQNTAAFLERAKVAGRAKFPSFLRWLQRMELDYRRDRFMSSVVEAIVLRELKLLKHKTRIPVEEGVTLFGICDETGWLEEDQIFITFDRCDASNHVDYTTLDGKMMLVTRSPAMHPGDVQIAMNVVPSESHPLRSLRNCIVFSQKGTRDLPSQLSGGDLDGDIFSVIWDSDAITADTLTFKPADYPRTPPRDIGRPVTREDMIGFFIDFMATDQLGLIATRHLILADQREAGTVSGDCKKLAKMASTAVDYSKTGIPVDDNDLRSIRYNGFRPDFMAPSAPMKLTKRTEISFDEAEFEDEEGDEDGNNAPRYDYYESEKILGKLYRAIDEKRIWHENVKIHPPHADDSSNLWEGFLLRAENECEALSIAPYRTRHTADAEMIRGIYEDAMWQATMDYSEHAYLPIEELEVFTGSIFNKTGVQTWRQRDRSLKLQDEFDRIVSMIQKRILMGRGNDESAAGRAYRLGRSLACVRAGLRPHGARKSSGGRGNDAEFQSFKIIAACCVVTELRKAAASAEMELVARFARFAEGGLGGLHPVGRTGNMGYQ